MYESLTKDELIEELRKRDDALKNTASQFRELFDRYSRASNSLLMLLENKPIGDVVTDILESVLNQFDGDRAYIFEYNRQIDQQSCIYEVVKPGVEPEIERLQCLPLSMNRWWTEELSALRPIIFDSLDDMPPQAQSEKEFLKIQGIQSIIAVPLISSNGVWGYMGIDIVNSHRKWSEIDCHWFSSLSNIISLCTQLRISEQTSRHNHEALQKLYENLPVGIEVYDKNGALVEVNDLELEIFGVKNKADILGVNLFDNPNLPDKYKEVIRLGSNVEYEIDYDFGDLDSYYKTSNRGLKHLLVRNAVLYDADNNIENYVLIVIDNTDSRITHSQLQEFEMLFNSIADFAGIGLCRWKPMRSKFMATDQWFKNLSQPNHKIESILEAYSCMHPNDESYMRECFDGLISGKLEAFRHEVRIKNGDDWRWLRCNFKVQSNVVDLREMEITGLNIDITEIKHTEIKLREAKTKAEEADKLKSAFLANMSHEIRTPLNAIVGFSDLMLDTEDKQECKQYMSIIRKNNDLLLQLVSDILDLSKIEAGMIETSIDTINFKNMCREIVCSYTMDVVEGVDLMFDESLPNVVIRSDRNRIMQIISNFINNALKFTEKGYVKLGYTIEGEMIRVYVEDTGMGISEQQLPTVFNRFVKLNSFINGTGLGLPICKSLVEKLGGTIGAESKQGLGSCFWFTLPYKYDVKSTPVPVKTVITNSREVAASRQKPVVLVAEDTDSNFILVSTILRKEYTILRAVDGVEAVNMFEAHHPDLVLMDMRMPNMGGLEATKAIRAKDTTTPIIAVTAFAFDRDRQKAFEAGCTDYMAKPINPVMLRELVRRLILKN